MSRTRSLFPGAMGPDGFISCFDQLMEPQRLRRTIVLKGGPGVGKSTFMRRLHAALGETGDSTLYFCSGDPDSLDAVALPSLGLLILDGTAPHIVDPQIPGARDVLVNLGECLDEAAMRPRLPQLRACMADHAAATRRARACLQAACALARDNAASVEEVVDAARLARMTRALIRAALPPCPAQEETPAMRRVITDAITPKGEVCLLSEGAVGRVIRLHGHWAQDLTSVLREVSFAARAAGFSVEEHLCPAVPGRLLHLSVPTLDLLITTNALLPAEQAFDFSVCIPQSALLRRESALEQGRTGVRMHIHRAASALAQAKQLHDELESFYVPHMDFARWQTKLDETLASLAEDAQ